MSIDKFLDRVPRPGYNCLSFAREVWLDIVNEDIKDQLDNLVNSITAGKLSLASAKGFRWLQKPESPCFVVMQRFRCTPHIGIYLDGRILHLRAYGAEYQPIKIAKAYFQTIRYYR